MRIRFRITQSDDATVQVVKPGGKVVVTLARDRFLKRYNFHTFYWDGRQRGGGIAPPGRYKLRVKLLGQDRTLVPPGTIRLHRVAGRAEAAGRRSRSGREARALSDFLAGAGVLVAAAACAAAILLPPGRPRSLAMLRGDRPLPGPDPRRPVAHPPDRRPAPRRHPHRALLAGAAVAVGLLAYVFRRWPILLPLAIVAALPFRVPLDAGGDTANLLVPLYLVIAAGVVCRPAARLDTAPASTCDPGGQLACAAGCLRRPLRGPDPLLRGLLEGAAERLLLPRPLHRRLPRCCARSSGTAGC